VVGLPSLSPVRLFSLLFFFFSFWWIQEDSGRWRGVVHFVGGNMCRSSSSSSSSSLVVSSFDLMYLLLLLLLLLFARTQQHQTMTSGSIAAWKLQPGDSFGAGDVYCSIETDKATMDFEAQDEGILAKILVNAGSGDVNVGDPIMVIVQDPAHVPAFANFTITTAAGGGTPAAAAAPPPPTPAKAVAVAPAAAVAAVSTVTTSAVGTSTTGHQHIVASPLARLLAHEKGYDIAALVGTGPGGRILAADVKEFVPQAAVAATTTTTSPAAKAAAPAPTTTATSAITSSDNTNNWALFSKQTVPHYYLTVDIRLDELQKLRQSPAWSSSKISVHACLIKAAALSMKTIPAANAAYLGDTTRYYQNVDLLVVGDTETVLKNCANLGLTAIETIVAADNAAADDATATTLDSTFSFCNLGMYGITSCAPIIRPPHACALAVGAAESVLVPLSSDNNKADGGPNYQTVTQLTATLSCDHRVVDGAVGAQWLATFKNYVENPTTLLL
jgi:pyruvate dehydrogenase E2 component (dihydrolipoamide acetyltransferase)